MEDEMTGIIGPPMAAALPPHLRLLLLTDGKRVSQVIHVLAVLGVADHLADGPRTVAELAKLTDTDTDALGRVLRVAASFGVPSSTEIVASVDRVAARRRVRVDCRIDLADEARRLGADDGSGEQATGFVGQPEVAVRQDAAMLLD